MLVPILGCLVKILLSIGGIGDIMRGMFIEALFQIKVMKSMWILLYMKKMLIEILKSGRFFHD